LIVFLLKTCSVLAVVLSKKCNSWSFVRKQTKFKQEAIEILRIAIQTEISTMTSVLLHRVLGLKSSNLVIHPALPLTLWPWGS
jgi:hypothetical protein